MRPSPFRHWVDTGSQRQFTFTYRTGFDAYSSATVAFNVVGPLAPSFTAQVGSAAATLDSNNNYAPSLLLLGLTFQGQSTGVIFSSSATPAPGNPGAYSWVQLLTGDQITVRTGAGRGNCTPPTPYPALDTGYPYGTLGKNLFSVMHPNDTATDNPSVAFVASWGEVQRQFSATMYLMWNPALTGSIPVPVASMAWQFTGDGINTLSLVPAPNGTTWTVPCGLGATGACVPSVPATDPNQSFPTWQQVSGRSWSCPI